MIAQEGCVHRHKSRPYFYVQTRIDFPGTVDWLDGAWCLDCGESVFRPSISEDARRPRNAWSKFEAIDAATLMEAYPGSRDDPLYVDPLYAGEGQ